jgi:predicted secreted hydrolase
MSRWQWLIIGLIILIGGAGLWAWLRPAPTAAEVSANLIAPNDAPPDPTGFALVTDPNGMTFPDAFGAHPDYQTEWWYYTGNIQTADGRPFGFQFTIFRRALTPDAPERTADFATNDIYMAHFTVTDGEAGQFYDNERFQRGAAGAAGATASPYAVWLDDWGVQETEPGVYQMRAVADEVAIDFTMTALKEPVRHGNNGLSPKSAEAGNASYYYSQTRLQTTGTVTVQGESYEVTGLSWKDHEYGTSSLAENAVGWDWFSLQLSDESDLMLFQIRTDDGGIEPMSSGSYILPDTTVQGLTRTDFTIEPLTTWTSPVTNGEYPAQWRLVLPAQGLDLTITPLIPNQELNVSVTYWEGAVLVEGTKNGQPISGRGYVELTGYTGEGVPSV